MARWGIEQRSSNSIIARNAHIALDDQFHSQIQGGLDSALMERSLLLLVVLTRMSLGVSWSWVW
jgi:hypothetical protein